MYVTVKTGYVTVGRECYGAGDTFEIDDEKGTFLVDSGVCEGEAVEAKPAKKTARKKKAETKAASVELPAADPAGAIVK